MLKVSHNVEDVKNEDEAEDAEDEDEDDDVPKIMLTAGHMTAWAANPSAIFLDMEGG